jgi:hypothetical protein
VNYLCRPGKLNGISATLGHVAPKTFYVFSTNACPFAGPHRDRDGNDRLGTAYDPFGIYARLKHGGDFAAAAKALPHKGTVILGGRLQPSELWRAVVSAPSTRRR